MQSRASAYSSDVWVVLPEGRLDAQAAPDLDHTLATLEAQGHTQVLLDLCLTTYISSSSLRIMLIYARRLRQIGGGLKVCCMPVRVAKVLCVAGFDRVFETYSSEELAVQSCLTPPPALAAKSTAREKQ